LKDKRKFESKGRDGRRHNAVAVVARNKEIEMRHTDNAKYNITKQEDNEMNDAIDPAALRRSALEGVACCYTVVKRRAASLEVGYEAHSNHLLPLERRTAM
jgi:hypothetical protein